MSPWTLCLLVVLAVAVVPSSSIDVARPQLAGIARQAMASAPAAEEAADIDVLSLLQCGTPCGPYTGLINALLLSVYQLVLSLLGTVNVALAFTLCLVYILLGIIQVTTSSQIGIALSGVILIIQKVVLIPGLGDLLRTVWLLLSGILYCLLRVLGLALPI